MLGRKKHSGLSPTENIVKQRYERDEREQSSEISEKKLEICKFYNDYRDTLVLEMLYHFSFFIPF